MPRRLAASEPSTTVGIPGGGVVEERARRGSVRAERRRSATGRSATTAMPPVSPTRSCRCAVRSRRTVRVAARRLRPADAPDHRLRVGRQLRCCRRDTSGRACTCEQVGAEAIESGQQVGAARRRDADDRDHRRDADGDAERGQHRAAAPDAQADGPDRQGVDEAAAAIGRARAVEAGGIRRRPRVSAPASTVTVAVMPPPSMPVAHGDTPRERRRDVAVVGDHHDGGAAACSSSSRSMISSPVRESRLPVGSSASTIAGSPTRARAMATRWRSPPESSRRAVRRPVRQADALERRSAAARAVRPAGRRGRPARWPRCRARSARRSGGTAGTRSRCSGRARPDRRRSLWVLRSEPSMRTTPDGGPVQRADDRQQRRLPRTRRSADRHELAAARSARSIESTARTGGVPGYSLVTSMSSRTASESGPRSCRHHHDVALVHVAVDLHPTVGERAGLHPDERRCLPPRCTWTA